MSNFSKADLLIILDKANNEFKSDFPDIETSITREYFRSKKYASEKNILNEFGSWGNFFKSVRFDISTKSKKQKKDEKELQEQLKIEQKKSEIAGWISKEKITEIKIPLPSKGHEAVAFAIASDWHLEENIPAASVNYYNEFNLEIGIQRTTNFFQNILKLTKLFQTDIKIDTLVLALLGDLMSGYIHEELMETNSLSPTQTVIELKRIIVSGINYLLNNSKVNMIVPCTVGNHGRTTEKLRIQTSFQNSYEWLLYHQIADEYRNEKRITFIIPESYHLYLPIYGKKIRFHHGNHISYGGGVGGITIPVNKAIAQWNQLEPNTDLDVFGHFHQNIFSKNFVSNGSLIGYGAYALSIKATPEKPAQSFFLYDSKHGKTVSAPIFLD